MIRSTTLALLLLLNSGAQAASIRERFLRLGSNSRDRQLWVSQPTSAPVCDPVIVDFDKDAFGNDLSPPLCVQFEWAPLGLTLFAEGGEGSLPCLFDTANLGSEREGGDSDLGAPNKYCTPSGPGRGDGGRPGEPGENCDPLGNVIIIQEPGVDVPDDNRGGGLLTLDFPQPGGTYVYEIGLLDIDEATSIVVIYENEDGDLLEKEITVPILGDNSKQMVVIDTDRGKYFVSISLKTACFL